MTLLEAISPTSRALLSAPAEGGLNFFPVEYTWNDPVFGELTAGTVIIGGDAEAALKSFRSKHPHLTGAKIV